MMLYYITLAVIGICTSCAFIWMLLSSISIICCKMKITSRFSLHCSFYPQLKVGIEEFKLEARTLSMLSNFLMQYLPLECTTFHAKELWCTLTHKNSGSVCFVVPLFFLMFVVYRTGSTCQA